MGPIKWVDLTWQDEFAVSKRRPFHDTQSGGLTSGEKVGYTLEDAMRKIAYAKGSSVVKKKMEPPVVGDKVRLKGRAPFGVLQYVTRDGWCEVTWDFAAQPGPRYVGLAELEKIK